MKVPLEQQALQPEPLLQEHLVQQEQLELFLLAAVQQV